MTTPTYNLVCTQNERIAEGIYDFRFIKPEGLKFEAGQFVLFDFPLIEDETDIQTRAFSIASSPLEEELIFVAKLIDGGRGSRWIEQKLKAGDTVRTQGPFGRFLLDPDQSKDCLFICTSSGIAPFRSQIITALKNGDNRKMDLIFGARSQNDLFWQSELDQLQSEYSNLNIHYVLSKPDEGWDGLCGYVQDQVSEILGDISNYLVFACGNPDMTKEIKVCCKEHWDVAKENMHIEGYI
ncbi:hypothetical protein HOC67_04645 [Candidatus Peregrinibacteria bacterium]|jgi:phenol/toluene 2-monooxygenase (NADH) P5/A5|nr:hypothetical protein [Candidatus Peregrinibacteria bacterium]